MTKTESRISECNEHDTFITLLNIMQSPRRAYMVRCAHFGDHHYVVEIGVKRLKGVGIDYVYYLERDLTNALIESHTVYNPELQEVVWQEVTDKMLQGIAPDGRGYEHD